MIRIFSSENKKFLKNISRSEADLNNFLSKNWTQFFPNYTFIASELSLEGNVRSRGTSGRIDIFAYNPITKKFIILELKKGKDKNIRNQASDYKDFVEENFAEIYLVATQKYNINLPKYLEISKDSIELILIAKSFSITDVNKAKKSTGEITLIRYMWFEENLLLIDYLNNDPYDLIEKENSEKVKKIREIVGVDNNILSEVDMFFNKNLVAKQLFFIFYNSLKEFSDDLKLLVQQSKIKTIISNHTFSIIGFSGKGPKKAFLQINTNIDKVSELSEKLIIDDRIRPNGKKKGSIGNERYEVYFTSKEDMLIFIELIKFDLQSS